MIDLLLLDMDLPFSFNSRFLLNIIHFAVHQGADKQHLTALTHHSEEELCSEDLRVSAAIYDNVLASAVEQTGNSCFGLNLGEYLNLTALGILGQITQSSNTVHQALLHLCEFASLGCQALPIQLVEDSKHYRITFSANPLWEQYSPLSVEHTVAANLTFALREYHALTRYKHYPLAIHLRCAVPQRLDEYKRLFQCPIYFNKDENAMLLNKALVNEPIVTSDHRLLPILLDHARQKLEDLEGQQGFSKRVKHTVLNLMKPQFPIVNQVATSMNLSVRTLQRRLKEEGQTYKAIMEDIRHQFAIQYLQRKDLNISEVAYMLDYAEASAFIRSFKRWEGTTPQAYRKTLMPN